MLNNPLKSQQKKAFTKPQTVDESINKLEKMYNEVDEILLMDNLEPEIAIKTFEIEQ